MQLAVLIIAVLFSVGNTEDALPAEPELDAPPAVPELDALPAVPELDAPPAVPELDAPPAVPELDAPPAVPELDAPPAVPELDAPPAVPELDAPPAEPELDAPPAVPELDAPPAVPELDALSAEPELDELPAVPELDAPPAEPELDALQAKPKLKMREPFKTLLKFIASNPEMAEAGLSAKTQLNDIYDFKEEWDKIQGTIPGASFWADVNESLGPKKCKKFKTKCKNEKYRSIDGTCNNLKKKDWGSSSSRAQLRLLDPDYFDKISSPRRAFDGTFLPSAREVSTKLLAKSPTATSQNSTLMLMQFGQFLDHDITHTPVAVNLVNGKPTNIVCDPNQCDLDVLDKERSECYPIPNIDGTTCTEFVRSGAVIANKCQLGPREQGNAITSYLDMSQVYGSEESVFLKLRNTSYGRGKMAVRENPVNEDLKPLLPSTSDKGQCRKVTEKITCFSAGDVRQNEQVGLSAMHTVFVRMHNFIEERLFEEVKKKGGSLGAEALFQKTRKILIGFWQNMVYSEYLPLILGDTITADYNIKSEKGGKFFTGYSKKVQADIFNAFSTAAFRFGHSQIPEYFTFVDPFYQNPRDVKLNNMIFDPNTLYTSQVSGMESAMDALVLGLISTNPGQVDGMFNPQITEHLFTATPPTGPGLDLAALNIQRGRDHGLPGYGKWREFCGLDVNLDDLQGESGQDIKAEFNNLYTNNINNVDLFPAGVSEKPVVDGILGPTFACIIARQFRALKFGDRFYYESKNDKTGFSEEQLAEVQKFTLARLLCDTLDDVDKIQPYVMLSPGVNPQEMSKSFTVTDNSIVSCNDIPSVDYGVLARALETKPKKPKKKKGRLLRVEAGGK